MTGLASPKLPAAVEWLCKHVFLDVLDDSQDFSTLLRKVVISGGLFYLVHPLGYCIYNLGLLLCGATEPTAGTSSSLPRAFCSHLCS